MKKSVKSDEKFSNVDFELFEAIAAVDRKDYGWWDKLTADQQRKFVPYMMVQWISTLKGSSGIAQYYLRSTDHYANMYIFNENIKDHPQLQWLMLCAASPGMGKQYHQWVGGITSKITGLHERAKLQDMRDWVEKSHGNTLTSQEQSALAQQLLAQQHKRYYLAQQCPHLKITDIETLDAITSDQEITQHQQDSGN